MIQNTWNDVVNITSKALKETQFIKGSDEVLPADAAFDIWQKITVKLRKEQGTIYLIGNGASASMASHFSADLTKNGGLHTQVFSDLSLITAVANDISFEQVFAEPLRTSAQKKDMLVAISSSGSSANILAAVRVALSMKMNVVTLSAMSSDNPLRKLGSLNIYVDAPTYGMAESCHSMILHRWMDMVSLKQDKDV